MDNLINIRSINFSMAFTHSCNFQTVLFGKNNRHGLAHLPILSGFNCACNIMIRKL